MKLHIVQLGFNKHTPENILFGYLAGKIKYYDIDVVFKNAMLTYKRKHP
jgi:hypothetical protein